MDWNGELEMKRWVNEMAHESGNETNGTLSLGGHAFDKVKEKYSGGLI